MLGRGKAALKDYLQSSAEIDVSTLPYDEDVLAYINSHRQRGGHVALVTATNQSIADNIAKHLQIFDEVHGSDKVVNLKGSNKAAFLVERFGQDSFCYMGDAQIDLPVWKASQKVITVNASSSLQKKTESLGKPVKHLVTTTVSLKSYINALRPHQWLKNFLIFLPMLAAQQFDATTFATSLLAFVTFSLIASSIYVLNDLLDLNADRAHPRKRNRPFASGALPIAHGSYLVLVLLISEMIVAFNLGWDFLLTLCVYFAMSTAYSLGLKRVMVLDICMLAGLYTMRIICGGVVTDIELSVWLLAYSIFIFLSLAAVKRQAELVDMAQRGVLKAKGRGYHADDLPIISMVALAAGYTSVLVLALYVNSPNMQQYYNFPAALWGICYVMLYWLTRIVLITHRGDMHDDPIMFAAKDRMSQICLVLICGFVLMGELL